jgi:hypothetical protein
LALGVDKVEGGYHINVYDNNHPDDAGRYVDVTTDAKGTVTGWSYDLGRKTYTNGRIVYIPDNVYNDVWEGRVNKTGGLTNVLVTNSRKFEIYDANNKLIARVEDGLLKDEADGVWQHHALRATEYSNEDEQDVVLTLPNGLCRIENQDNSVSQLETRISDQEQMATVTTQATSVALAVDDDQDTNVASIATSSGQTYNVTLESALPSASGKETVEVTGTGIGNNVSVGVSKGALDTASAVGAIVKINGVVQTSGIGDGKTAIVGGSTYLVKSNAAGTVYFHKAPKSKKNVTIPSTVTINGKTYKVAGISKKAFKSTKARKVTVKTKLLTKKSVKKCFTGAKKVKTVKVSVGSKKDNKKYSKRYAKYFAKKNSGAKVTVK